MCVSVCACAHTCVELEAVREVRSHPDTQSDMGTPRALGSLELTYWFLNLMNYIQCLKLGYGRVEVVG